MRPWLAWSLLMYTKQASYSGQSSSLCFLSSGATGICHHFWHRGSWKSNGKVFFWVIWKPEGLLLCEGLVLGGRTSRSQPPPYSKVTNPSIIAEMLDLRWLWKKKWWALWFQLRRRLGRKITGAQEFLVNIVRASLLKETNRYFIRNSSHLPLWVPGTDLGLSSLHSRLSHVTGSARFIVSIL